MDAVANPYTPGAGTRPPALTGRDQEIDRFRIFTRRILAQRPEKGLIITGLRGVGKTVLLNTFSDLGESTGFITAHYEMSEDTNFPATVARLCNRALLKMSLKERARDRVRRALGLLKAFTITIPDGPKIAIDVDMIPGRGDSGELSEDLADLFVELGEAARDAEEGVLFLLDEIQYLHESHLAALITAVHRVTQKTLPVAVVGAGLPQLPKLAGDAKSYAERLFDFPQIGSLREADALEAIERPARELKVDFDRHAALLIVEKTEGYPYFLQEFGKHVWNIATGSPISVGDVEAAAPAVQAQLDENFFRVRVDRATLGEKRYMRAMAELGRGPYRSGEIAAQLRVKTTSLGPVRANLISKGFIFSPSHGLNDFTVPQFDDFMRRNFPPPREM